VRRAALVTAGALLVSACASGPPARDDPWRRAFVGSAERVHGVAVDVLLDLDYDILDDDGDRIRARGRVAGAARTVILELGLSPGDEWVVVDVQGRTDAGGGPSDLDQIARASAAVLAAMAERLPVL
jgi:hypothetical protein